jgi:hypothetical protein
MQLLAKDSQEVQKVLSKIVAKTWLDDGLKEQFLTNTNAVLEENGLTLPSGVEFKVNENTLVGIQKSTADSQGNNVVYEIPLPEKPEGLADQPIQSWSSGNNSDSPDADYESDCKISM